MKSTVLLEGHVTESLRSIKFNILRSVAMDGREVRRAVEKRRKRCTNRAIRALYPGSNAGRRLVTNGLGDKTADGAIRKSVGLQ